MGGGVLDVGCGTSTAFGNLVRNSGRQCFYRTMPDSWRPMKGHEVGLWSAVTALAVVEHMPLDEIREFFAEAHRVLRPGGALIVTTPPPYVDWLLRGMARLNLVSREEIDEHQTYLTIGATRQLMRGAGFYVTHAGRFEWGLNQWIRGTKS
jgi:cyclopropane fatty-acyl-phospholipid synthase-like methyltransferase